MVAFPQRITRDPLRYEHPFDVTGKKSLNNAEGVRDPVIEQLHRLQHLAERADPTDDFI